MPDHPAAAVSTATHNPLAPYRIFVATVRRGPDAGFTLKGPLVLGYDGRIQVIGYLYQTNGPRLTVVGTVYGGGVALRIVIPGKHSVASVEAAGTGQLENVRGGLPGGLTLVGYGNLNGPAINKDSGYWETLRP